MKLSELENTKDEQFLKDITFNALMPSDEGEVKTELKLTVKSARNPEVKGKLGKLIRESEKESKKLENPNLTDAQIKTISEKTSAIDYQIAELMFVSFSGLTDDNDKPVKSTEESKKSLVENYGWIRDNIVSKATSQAAFFTK